MLALTRRYHFPAAHVLTTPRLSPEENLRIYGKCANPAGHGFAGYSDRMHALQCGDLTGTRMAPELHIEA